jgi:hypothetical protein
MWGAFIALVDDGFDQGPEQDGSAEVRQLMDQLLAVLSEDEDGYGAPLDAAPPAVRALADLWPRTVAGTRHGWPAQFIRRYRQFAEATVVEAELRESNERISLRRYLELRRHTITVLPVLELVERFLPADGGLLDGLRDIVADTIAWVNDLASAPRELARGQENLVSVLMRERGVDQIEAMTMTRAMISERIDDFDSAAASLAVSATHHPGLAGRVERLRECRDGAIAWQRETQRNQPDQAYAAAPAGPAVRDTRDAIRSLTQNLALAVDATGVVNDRCASRILESTLLLALVRETGTHETVQARLRDYLLARRAAAGRLDSLLIDACLDPEDTSGRAVSEAAAIDSGPSHRPGRGQLKAAMLRAVLHLLCGAPLDEADTPPKVAPDKITTFTDVHLLATRVIYGRATGHPHEVNDEERERLIRLLASGRDRFFWEASATTHLLGLHAVRTFRPSHTVLDDGILRMALMQNRDGGLPFLDSQDLWLTAVAGLAFLGSPELRPLTARMADFVASWQAADGAWPFAAGMAQTDLDTATRCMEFLQAADPQRYRRHLDRGARYVTGMAGPDGGFPTWVREDTPDLDMTAGAVLALAPDWNQYQVLLSRAIAFILDAQLPDGTFERSWTISESSAILRALDALHAMPGPAAATAARIRTATGRAVAHLAVTQNPDGGWGQLADADSNVLSTAQAVLAMARYGDRLAVHRGIAYLLSQQLPGGRFTSIPDQVGPRPLPFDYPVLASIHSLPALLTTEIR